MSKTNTAPQSNAASFTLNSTMGDMLKLLSENKITMEQFQVWDTARLANAKAAGKAEATPAGDAWRQPKVTEKGCLNLGRIPGANAQFGCVGYVAMFEYILKHEGKIREFIAANNSKLSRK